MGMRVVRERKINRKRKRRRVKMNFKTVRARRIQRRC
jgi:hypothetical protein